MRTVVTTEHEMLLLRYMQKAYSDMNVSSALKLEGVKKKVGDQLVIKGFANRTRDGRYVASHEGLRMDTHRGTA